MEKISMTRYHIFVVLIAYIGWIVVQFDSYAFFVSYPTIMKEFNIELTQVGVVITIGVIASWILSFLAGPAMDYLGRKLVLQVTLILTALGSLLTGLCVGWKSLIGATAIVQGSASAEMPAGLTITSEEVHPRVRGPAVGLIQSGVPVGYFLASWAASYIIPRFGWRILFYLGIIPVIVVIIARIWLREPQRNVEVMALRKQEKTELKHDVNVEKAKQFTVAQLFARDLRRQTILCATFVALIDFGAAGINFFIPAIVPALGFTLEQFYTVSIYGTAAGIFGYLACAFLGEWIGRRKAVLYFLIPGVISNLLLTYYSSSYGLLILFYVGYWIFGMGTFSAMMGYFLEVFPTRVRGTAMAFLTSCLWASIAITSFVGPYFLKYFGPRGTLLVYGVICFALSLVCFFFVREVPPGLELEDVAT